MEMWNKGKLNSLFILKNDKAKQIKSSEYLENGQYPVVDQSIDFICGYYEKPEKVNFEGLPLTIFGDHTRHVKYVSFPFVAGADGTQLLKPISLLTDKYFYYLVLYASGRIANHGYDRHLKHLRDFEVSFPSSKIEQSTIATILTTIDQAIEKTEQLIAKYERIKTGLMQDLLTRGIDEQGNIRSEETHEFKDSVLGRIPREWEVGTIGKDCRIQNSFRKPLSAEVREYMKGKYPYYGPTGILDYINEFRVDGKYVLIGEDGDHFLKFFSQEMTLLIEGKFNVNNHAHILEGKDECLTEWIHCFFCHRDITYHLTRQGAGRYKLNKATLLNLPIAIPKKGEQLRIIQMAEGIRDYLKRENETLNNYKKLKAGLMQDLLTGKVLVDALMKNKELFTSPMTF